MSSRTVEFTLSIDDFQSRPEIQAIMRACGLVMVPIRVKHRSKRGTVHVRMSGKFNDGAPFHATLSAKSTKASDEDMKSYLKRAGFDAFLSELLSVPPARAIIENFSMHGPLQGVGVSAYL